MKTMETLRRNAIFRLHFASTIARQADGRLVPSVMAVSPTSLYWAELANDDGVTDPIERLTPK